MKGKKIKKLTGLFLALSMVFGGFSAFALAKSDRSYTVVCAEEAQEEPVEEEIAPENPEEEEPTSIEDPTTPVDPGTTEESPSEEDPTTPVDPGSTEEPTSEEEPSSGEDSGSSESSSESSSGVTGFGKNDIFTIFKIIGKIFKDAFKELFKSLRNIGKD